MAGLVVAAILGTAIGLMTGIYFVYQRSTFLRFIPDGAPMASEFGPQGFSVRAGDYHHQVALTRILFVLVHDDGMVVAATEGEKNRRRAPVVVPRELLPPEVANDYQNRFKTVALRTKPKHG